MRRCLLSLSVLVALVALAVPASAATPIASYSTPGCDAAPTWRVAYRMFWSDAQGRTLDRAQRDSAWASARQFADIVGTDSACSVRIHLDLYDEAGPWTGTPGARDIEFPEDAGAFREAGKYDSVFYRGPAAGVEEFAGITDYTNVWFPVRPESRASAPNPLLVEHEWLHGVVEFYSGKISQGWPRDDVHGASNYPPHSGQVDREFFAKMMTGRVAEPDGRMTGILPGEWAYFGTPVEPLHATPEPGVEFDEERVRGVAPDDLDSEAVLRLINPTSGQVVSSARLVNGRAQLSIPTSGRWRACVAIAEGRRYRAAEECGEETVRVVREVKLKLRKRSNQRLQLSVLTPSAIGRKMTVRWVYYSGCSITNPSCNRKIIRRTVTLRHAQTLRKPRAIRRGEGLHAETAMRPYTVNGVTYRHDNSQRLTIKR